PGELRFASEAEITAWFKGCQPGGVPPLRLRSDQVLLMDRSLAHFGHLVFAAGTCEDAVALRFRDWYRMARPGVARFGQASDGRAAAGAPASVLVVEDEADTNHLLCRLLEREGFACCGAEDGGQALDLALQMRPSAILLDLMLPDMSGFDL